MKSELRIRVIKTEKQYFEYCDRLEYLVEHYPEVAADEIELLNVLIEKWDDEHRDTEHEDLDAIDYLHLLMEENGLKNKDLCNILSLSKGTVSKILNRKKGLSKASIRKLADYFKVQQEVFNKVHNSSDQNIPA